MAANSALLQGDWRDWLQDENSLESRLSFTDSTVSDFNELRRASLERVLHKELDKDHVLVPEGAGFKLVDLRKLNKEDKELLLEKIFPGGSTQVTIVSKIQERFERAGVSLNDVEVRWRELTITGKVGVGAAGLPTLSQDLMNKVKKAVPCGSSDNLRSISIMDRAQGVLKPGRFTLLLGPPGSGKSVLMRALAGQLGGEKTIKVDAGELTYNGLPLSDFVVERSAAYVSQIDTHFAELTVRETLDFSARCQGMEMRKNLVQQVEAAEKAKGITPDPELAAIMTATNKSGKTNMITEIIIRILGLHVCADTVVGNAMLRGISGGQKKRVTTGEMMVGPQKVFFLDEISTGLDSATTYDITKSLGTVCHTMKHTMLVALLQPAPETFDLFDDIILLSSGHIVYHGPREGVLPFFESLGFVCPERKGVADFLQEVTSPSNQHLFWARPEPYSPVSSADFAQAFYNTSAGRAIIEELTKPLDPSTREQGQLSTTQFGRPFGALLKANLRNTWILQKRNLPFHVIRIFQTILMGFIVGTLFLQQSKQNMSDAQLFMGVAFFSCLYMMSGAFPDSIIMVQRLPVFYKQRDAHFYPAWCYSFPQIMLRLPWAFVETWIWTLMVYYLVGFYNSVRVLVFWGTMFSASIFSSSLFMAIGAIARTQTVTSALQAFMLLIFISTSGFTLVSSSIPGGWKGAYWSNPMAYFIRAVLINEMTSPDWGQPLPNGNTLGEQALINRGFQTEYKWVWIALFAWGMGTFVTNSAIMVAAFQFLSSPKHVTIVSEDFISERSGDAGTRASSRKAAATSGQDSPKLGLDVEKGAVAAPAPTKKEGTLPFKPLTLSFKFMQYSVPIPPSQAGAPVFTNEGPHAGQLMLLKGITGSFRPGVLTALMGASGAGKTTLMDVLAGRKTGGTITGDILLNGFQKEPKTFARVMGYVEQTDVHVPETTVHEALVFSASLRLPSNVPDQTMRSFVDEVMELVDLTGIKDSPVGLPGESGLSVEQRKRLTIAVELVANPSIVFMDEPTSGLDARAASIVMRTVRNTVNTGRTVVCTIHQPSIEIFEAFDELLLLKRGGETIFHGAIGKDAAQLIAYFSSVPGVPAIKPRYNPANWMLELSSPDAEAATGINFAEAFQTSEVARSQDALVDSLAAPPPGDAALRYEDMHVASVLRQLRLLLTRNSWQYRRALPYNGTRLLISLVIGICFGTLYWDKGSDIGTFNGVMNIVGALYMSVLFLGILDCMQVQDVISVRRTVYYREHAAGMYSSVPYSLAEVLVEVPYLLAQSMIYSLLVYWMIGFEATAAKFFWFWLMMMLTLTYWTFFGIQNVHITPALQLSNALSAMFFGLFNVFCGFLIPQPSIPAGWIWAYYIDPVTWTLYGLIVGQLGDKDDATIVNAEGVTQTIPEFLESYWGYKYSMKGWTAAILCAYVLFFATTATLALRKLNFQKR